ncbi:aminotransferase class III-fold pyridoxal phosphate-dependent enzyme [Micromonospora sp. DT4]|uniref:aminotransferase class III-fold pyridoxal phosphate-dependent enzyme n=1 Tax=Micromonospora sp. DT4 TaxID=3393438 RepID=UPI003CF8C4EC
MTGPRLSRNTRPRRGHVSLVGGRGAVFRDVHGTEYVDLCSQTVNLLFGQAHPAINRSVVERLAEYTFFDQDFDSPEDRRAVEQLSSLLPAELLAFNTKMCNGSDAVESAVKQARRATGHSRVITLRGIYLGQSSQTINLRGLGTRPADILNGSTEDVVFAPLPYCPEHDHDPLACPLENGQAICDLVDRHRDELACVLLDPLMLSSGVCTGRAMPVLLRRVREHTRKLGVPLVLDESQTFGWVPEHTLATHWGVTPDALVLAKGVAGGFPLAITAAQDRLDTLEWGEADYTNGGHPAAIAALAATCRLLRDPAEQQHFATLVGVLDEELADGWGGVVRSRGVGLIRVVEPLEQGRPIDPARVRQLADDCLKRGVYVRPYGTALGVKPPRVITPDQLRDSLRVIREVLVAEPTHEPTEVLA